MSEASVMRELVLIGIRISAGPSDNFSPSPRGRGRILVRTSPNLIPMGFDPAIHCGTGADTHGQIRSGHHVGNIT